MKILNQAQAEAVYAAMCQLNNVGGRIDARLEDCRVADRGIQICVYKCLDGEWEPGELYADQNAFAAAYGLDCEVAA